MIVYPAIDIYEGKVVRLIRGDYSQMTIYSDDPVQMALSFASAGAQAAHIVDLEGARDGKPANFDIIRRIVAETGLEIQTGGGIRDRETVEKYLSIGVRRVILGTVAVSKPGFLAEMVRLYGDAIAVAADIKDGFIAIKGWTELSDKDIFEFCRIIGDIGVKTLICTDISKDGLLGGANTELYRALREKQTMAIIASGGLTSVDEIFGLAALGLDGVILGKALYTGSIDLKEALAAAREALHYDN